MTETRRQSHIARAQRARRLIAEINEAMFDLERLCGRIETLKRSVAELQAELSTIAPQTAHGLSHQEFHVLRMIACGYSVAQIAAKLHIAYGTARHHLSAVLRKLAVESNIQAALYAWRNDIVSVNEAWEVVKTTQWARLPHRNRDRA